MGMAYDGEDIFRGCLVGVVDVSDLDATMDFDEARRILNQANLIPRYYICF